MNLYKAVASNTMVKTEVLKMYTYTNILYSKTKV